MFFSAEQTFVKKERKNKKDLNKTNERRKPTDWEVYERPSEFLSDQTFFFEKLKKNIFFQIFFLV